MIYAMGDDDNESYRPPQALYSPEREALDAVVNEVRMMRSEAISMRGGTPNKIKFRPTPFNALEDAEQRARKKEHAALAARMLPHKYRNAEG